MLSYNVADLLRSAPGTAQRHDFAVDDLVVAEDVPLARPVSGNVRLSRTSRSILVRGHLETALAKTCSRCLRPAEAAVSAELDEEVLPAVDIDTGIPVDVAGEPETPRLTDHHELDLEPLLRDAISLAEPIAPLCRPDCPGLCVTCGADLASDPGHTHAVEDIDPRLVGLAALRDRLS
ncbi:hypothetical protein BH23CHL8_BH23CHL8_22090 [soil metagenome]